MLTALKKDHDTVDPSTQHTPAEPTTAEARKTKAHARAQQLEQERVQMQTRLQETAAELGRVQQEILERERAGTAEDLKALRQLRERRLEMQQRVEDMSRILPTIEAELQLVGQEMQAAVFACGVDVYNPNVVQHRERVRRILAAVREFDTRLKDLLAEYVTGATQLQGQFRAMGLPDQMATPTHLSSLYLRDALALLQRGIVTPKDYAAETSDWSLRTMNDAGELVAPAPSQATIQRTL